MLTMMEKKTNGKGELSDRTASLVYQATGCFADKSVVGESYYRAIQINVIIHLNTGINMLTLFLKYHYLDHHFASAKFSNA